MSDESIVATKLSCLLLIKYYMNNSTAFGEFISNEYFKGVKSKWSIVCSIPKSNQVLMQLILSTEEK
jgi:hypothetical protein